MKCTIRIHSWRSSKSLYFFGKRCSLVSHPFHGLAYARKGDLVNSLGVSFLFIFCIHTHQIRHWLDLKRNGNLQTNTSFIVESVDFCMPVEMGVSILGVVKPVCNIATFENNEVILCLHNYVYVRLNVVLFLFFQGNFLKLYMFNIFYDFQE